jgi:hypothetical protein
MSWSQYRYGTLDAGTLSHGFVRKWWQVGSAIGPGAKRDTSIDQSRTLRYCTIVMDKSVSLLLLVFFAATPVLASDEEVQAPASPVQHRSDRTYSFWDGSSFKYIPMFRRVPIPNDDHQIFRLPAGLSRMEEKPTLFHLNTFRTLPVLDKPIVPMGDFDQAVPAA